MRRPTRPREILTPATLQILLSLADGARHGLGIQQDVETRTAGALRLGPGTLYEGIHRLERAGWISEVQAASDEDSRRRFYRLTAQGRRQLEGELRRLDEIVRYAKARDLLPGVSGT